MQKDNIFNFGNFFKKVLDKNLDEIAQKHNLRRTEISVILYLDMNKGKDVASVDLVQDLLLTKSHVSISVNNLVARGVLVKITDKSNRKKEYLNLTPKAEDIIDDIKKQRHLLLKQMFAGFTQEEVKILQSLLARVVYNIMPKF